MSKARQGAMSSMSSVVRLAGNGNQANYAAKKLVTVVLPSVARGAARGVRVNVLPGFIEDQI